MERSPVGSPFSELLFLDVPGTAMEQVRTCGSRRNSSIFDRAPKIRDSVLLNSFESFLVTLPSITSETWKCILEQFLDQAFSATDYSPYSQVFLSKVLLISPYFSKLP